MLAGEVEFDRVEMSAEKLSQWEGKGWYEQIEVILAGTGEQCEGLLVEYSANKGHAGESLFDDYSVRWHCTVNEVRCCAPTYP